MTSTRALFQPLAALQRIALISILLAKLAACASGIEDTSTPLPPRTTPASPPILASIVFARTASTHNNDLYLVKEDSSGVVTLANSTDDEAFSGITAGGRVIYTRLVGTQSDLYSVSVDGTGTMALATSTDNEIFKGITPSGRVIYEKSAGTQSDLYSVNADGADTVALANSTNTRLSTASLPADE